MKRALLVAAIVAYFAIALLWIWADRRVPQQAFDKYSSENTSADGTSLARRYLARRGPSLELTRPLAAGLVPRDGVVFRIVESRAPLFTIGDFPDDEDDDAPRRPAKKGQPAPPKPLVKPKPPTPLISAAEDEWIRDGGRLVLAIENSYGPLDVRNHGGGVARKTFPIWPGIDAVPLPHARTLAGDLALRRTHALFIDGTDPVIARQEIGRGDLLLVAAPELFTNGELAKGNHLALLDAIAARRPVYFDEVVHGLISDAGMIGLMRDWNLGPFLAVMLLAGVMVFWRGGRAVGAREDDFRDTRSDAIDLVSSLGALYDRSMTPGEAIAVYHYELTRAVAAHTGLRGDALKTRVDAMTGGVVPPRKHDPLNGEQFQELLARLNDSFRRIEHANH